MKHLLALALLALAACGKESVSVVTGLESAVPYDNAVLPELWYEVQLCSGLRGDLGDVHFFLAVDGIQKDGVTLGGYWRRAGNEIYLIPPYHEDSKTIKHEMMHALLQRGDHPDEYFNGVCGKLIY